MDGKDLMTMLSSVITKRLIQIGFWVFVVIAAVGFGGKVLGWW